MAGGRAGGPGAPVRIAMVSRHLPEPQGTAAGRALWALGEGLVAAGHDLDVWSWWYDPPAAELPAWCTWVPLPPEPGVRTRARALLRPRSDVVRARWQPPAGVDVVVADDPVSFPAVAGHDRSILTVHYSTVLDAAALGDRSPRAWQDRRAERAFARRAGGVVAYSARVAAALGGRAVVAPIAVPLPPPQDPVDAPVAVCAADWRWPPNAQAAALLRRAWAQVRAELPAARLELAGVGSQAFDDPATGVRGHGRVEGVAELLAGAAVLAFPCPPTSGPKVKVLEAMAQGLPVVTTMAGAEGIGAADDPTVAEALTVAPADPAAFAAALVGLLSDPGRRRQQATTARQLVLAHHAPGPAAQRRVAAWTGSLAHPR